MSNFDPDQFLHQEAEGEMDTEIIPPPAGEWPAKIDNVKVQSGEKDGEPWYAADINWDLSENREVLEECQREKVTARQRLFLDVEDDGSGGVKLSTAKGKNVGLGRLREAVGMNEGTFSLSMLEGARAMVQVTHRTVGDTTMANVNRVAPLE